MMLSARNLIPLTLMVILVSCSNRNINYGAKEDKELFAVIRTLSKKPTDAKAGAAFPYLYEQTLKRHEDKIEAHRNSNTAYRWDIITKAYENLQQIMDVLNANPSIARLVNTRNYYSLLSQARDSAAADYYATGENYLREETGTAARKAYHAFKRAGAYVPGYKDVDLKMQQAYQKGILNVVINPVGNNNFYNAGWNGDLFRNGYMQQSLVRDLGGRYATYSPARFYTDRDASYERIHPDRVIDLNWKDIRFNEPLEYITTREVSKKIQVKNPTTGMPETQTVTATLRITRRTMTATAEMECRITDLETRRNLGWNNYPGNFNWERQHATYTGDSRALDDNDTRLVNTRSRNYPSREEVMNELYREIYPRVKSGIANAMNW
jgi:hypothetical protein